MGIALATSNLGRVAARARRFDEALELLAEALAAFEALGSEALARETEARRAECFVLAGRYQEALARPNRPRRPGSRGREPGDPRAPRRSLDAARAAALKNGAPGLEKRLSMIYEFGVRAGRIS